MALSAEKEFLEVKLVFLEKQEQRLCTLIQEKFRKVVTNGKAWLSNSGKEEARCSFTDMNQVVEDTAKFVTRILKEFEDVSEQSLPQASAVQSNASPSVTSYDSSQLPTAKNEKKSPESRIKKMEAAVTAITDNLEMLMTRLTNVENGMGDLSAKHFKTEDNWMKQFNQANDKMTDLRQREDEFVQQHDREIQSLKEELKTMRNSQYELKRDKEDQNEGNLTLQATLDTLQQDMGTVQVEVQKLRDAIQEQAESIQASKDDATKLKKITGELSSLSPRIQSLESKCARPAVGFTALAQCDSPTEGANVQWDKRSVKCNTEKSFNADTGIFTAPVKGVYFISLRLWQIYVGDIGLEVWQTRKSSTSVSSSGHQELFFTYTSKTHSGDTGMTVTDMDGGDTVYVKVYTKSGEIYLNDGTQLTCCLIG